MLAGCFAVWKSSIGPPVKVRLGLCGVGEGEVDPALGVLLDMLGICREGPKESKLGVSSSKSIRRELGSFDAAGGRMVSVADKSSRPNAPNAAASSSSIARERRISSNTQESRPPKSYPVMLKTLRFADFRYEPPLTHYVRPLPMVMGQQDCLGNLLLASKSRNAQANLSAK